MLLRNVIWRVLVEGKDFILDKGHSYRHRSKRCCRRRVERIRDGNDVIEGIVVTEQNM